MIKIKICGITKIEDAIFSAKEGAFAIGFIFYSKSKRYIEPKAAKDIALAARELKVKTIGVFVNETPAKINEIADMVGLDYVQLHGTESPADCQYLKIPYIKNIRSLSDVMKYDTAEIFLVDAKDTVDWGGTGKLGDWELAKQIKAQGKKVMLSGGISINNVTEAINEVNPDYLDVSSSLEIFSGVKSHELIQDFFEKAVNMEHN